jgi:hypothetical protein
MDARGEPSLFVTGASLDGTPVLFPRSTVNALVDINLFINSSLIYAELARGRVMMYTTWRGRSEPKVGRGGDSS